MARSAAAAAATAAAAVEFSGRHTTNATRAERLLGALAGDASSPAKVASFDRSLHELRRNRMYVDERAAAAKAAAPPIDVRTPPPAEAVPDGGGGSDEASDEEWVDPSASVAPLKAAAAFRRLLR